jgi:hypothetical protein
MRLGSKRGRRQGLVAGRIRVVAAASAAVISSGGSGTDAYRHAAAHGGTTVDPAPICGAAIDSASMNRTVIDMAAMNATASTS